MDACYMRQALELAGKGAGRVNPNPMVGAVIVKDGRVIGEGYHQHYGGPHAEVNAFRNAVEAVEGSTMYVTLEPCCHYGKTPPCVNAIIENKIKRVVIGTLDPNPLVAGKGVKILKEEGIEVVIGVLEEECKKINEAFIKYISTKKPFVLMKAAMTLDGKIGTRIGDSKWITSEEARLEVHRLRNQMSAIMVGIGTVVKDDPELTCRIEGGKNPKRIIVDSGLRIPEQAKVLQMEDEAGTIIATTKRAEKDKIKRLESKGVGVLILPEQQGKVDLQSLMVHLGEQKIDSILLEGGSTLNYSALEAGIVDKVQFYIAPKLLGGEQAPTAVGGEGVSHLKEAFELYDRTFTTVGEELRVEGYVRKEERKVCLQG